MPEQPKQPWLQGTTGADRTLPDDQSYEEWTETRHIKDFGADMDAASPGGTVIYSLGGSPGVEVTEITLIFDNG